MKKHFAHLLYLLFGVLLGGGLMFVIMDKPAKPMKQLIVHTISKGGSACVVYLERWDGPSWADCRSFDIVWPAGASQGHVQYMLEHRKGKIHHQFRRVGWWDEKADSLITIN